MTSAPKILMRIAVGLVTLAALVVSIPVQAQRVDTLRVTVYYHLSRYALDPDFMGNGAALDSFARAYRELPGQPSPLTVQGYASPEGTIALNRMLSERRAAALADYLSDRLGIPDSLITRQALGVAWEALYKAVEADPAVPKRERVLQIIRTVPDTVYNARHEWISGRKHELMNLYYGRSWNYMLEHIYPRLRGASAEVMCIVPVPEAVEPEPEPQPEVIEAQPVGTLAPAEPTDHPEAQAAEPKPAVPRYPIFALRSNLLLPLLNVGVEVPVGKHWSVGADYYYPWVWPKSNNKNCFELIFVSAEARYWFNARDSRVPGRNFLKGHSVAAYGAWGYYDFEHNWKGHQGHGWSAGLDYVYALPVAKGKLRLEFQLAVGGVWSPKAQPYKVYESGGKLIRETGLHKNYTYFGPTKVGVSLVVPITVKVK